MNGFCVIWVTKNPPGGGSSARKRWRALFDKKEDCVGGVGGHVLKEKYVPKVVHLSSSEGIKFSDGASTNLPPFDR